MGVTIAINQKGNVKQNSEADLISSQLQQPVIARYEATSSAAQTIISLPFLVNQSNTDAFDLFINGALLRSGASNDYTFTSIDGTNSSSQVTLNGPIAANLNIIAIKRGLKKEVEFATDARFTQNYDLMTAGFQGFVDESSKLTAINGTPGAGQFRTFGIQNRAQIPDLANDLRVRMSVDRIATEFPTTLLQNEFGPAGEPVSATPNDDRGLIRFVGNWTSTVASTTGSYVAASTGTADYVEVVFYGTGLNLLGAPNATLDIRATVDAGAESGNLASATYSTILAARNYMPNIVYPITTGLTLGLHTVKIRSVSATNVISIGGFEILNESANVNVRPGTAYQNGKKLVSSSASSVAYNSGFETVTREGSAVAFSSTRGARVLEYIKSDGSKAKAAYLTNAAQGNLGSADHTYEEVVRTYNWREFGAGRFTANDDFSVVTTSVVNRAFTLDDDTANLVGQGAQQSSTTGELQVSTTNDYLVFAFVGTGIDITQLDNGSTIDTFTYLIDGSSIGTATAVGTASVPRIRKIVSGLPYGTHTLKIRRDTAAGSALTVRNITVYGPKKPTLPTGAVELADYNIMADYVGTAVNSIDAKSTGVLTKGNMREMIYVGTWATAISVTGGPSGWITTTSTTNDYVEYTFFGTGVDIAARDGGAGCTATVRFDGVLYTGAATSIGGTSTWTPGTSTWALNAGAGPGSKLRISGLTLGTHTVRLTRSGGADQLVMMGFDIITPIYSYRNNFQGTAQNALPAGSCGISDIRKTAPVNNPARVKYRAVARGVNNNPTTTSTVDVPMPDMALVVPSIGGWFSVTYNWTSNNGTADNETSIYVDGVAYGTKGFAGGTAASTYAQGGYELIYLSPGAHHIAIYWNNAGSGTIQAQSRYRNITVQEL